MLELFIGIVLFSILALISYYVDKHEKPRDAYDWEDEDVG